MSDRPATISGASSPDDGVPAPSGAVAPKDTRAGWVGSLLLVLLALAWALLWSVPALGNRLGLDLSGGWFIDVHALLAAGEAHVQGIPIHAYNPLDMFGRPHSYSHWWLVFGPWGLTRADAGWLGAMLVGAFLAVAAVSLRPRTVGQLAWGAVVLLAPTTQLCLVRANNDLAVFLVLAPLAAALVSSRTWVRFGAAGLIAFATGLKYYPAVAGILLLAERDVRLGRWRLAAAVVLLGLVGWSVREDLRHLATALPSPSGIFAFGAAAGVELLRLPQAATGVLLLGLVALAIAREARRPGVSVAPTRDELGFLLGAALLAGCFWTGMNWGYRWIFVLWLLPALLRPANPSFVVRAGERRALLVLLPVCLWADGLAALAWNVGALRWAGIASAGRYMELLWMALQPVHWATISLLTVACVRFVWRESRRLAGWERRTAAAVG